MYPRAFHYHRADSLEKEVTLLQDGSGIAVSPVRSRTVLLA
jgi:hypothetical protein